MSLAGVRAEQMACTEARLMGCSVCPYLVESEDRTATNTQNITLLKSLDWISGSPTFSSQKQLWQTIKHSHRRQEKTTFTKNWEITHSFPGRISLEVILSSPVPPGRLTVAAPQNDGNLPSSLGLRPHDPMQVMGRITHYSDSRALWFALGL